jgi:hypothetical protein
MKKMFFSLATLALLIGCGNANDNKSKAGSSSVKSVEYYKAHWEEAEKKVEACTDFFDEECINAYEGRYSKGQLEVVQKMQRLKEENKKRPKNEFGF